MGSADAVPGVSGGTIALILGIYERMINAVTSITSQRVLEALNFAEISEAKKSFRAMDGAFLLVLGTGILTAVVSVLRLMQFLLTSYPVPTYGFFSGLIAFSAIIMLSQVNLSGWRLKLVALTGFSVAFIASGLSAADMGHYHPLIFFSGVLAVTAMALPGISGSLLLIVIGQYEYMSGALTDFTDAFIPLISGDFSPLIEASPPIAFFMLGGLVGLFTVAHSVKWSLERHREATYIFLVGLIAGALRAPLAEVERVITDTNLTWIQVLPEFTVAASLGALMIYVVYFFSDSVDYL